MNDYKSMIFEDELDKAQILDNILKNDKTGFIKKTKEDIKWIEEEFYYVEDTYNNKVYFTKRMIDYLTIKYVKQWQEEEDFFLII